MEEVIYKGKMSGRAGLLRCFWENRKLFAAALNIAGAQLNLLISF
jgi:hypothetical protein